MATCVIKIIRLKLPNSILIIIARLSSGVNGFIILALAANLLTVVQFGEVALFQTIIFLLSMSFDAGTTQYAIRETAGNSNWQKLEERFQGIRYTMHLVMGLLLSLMVFFGVIFTEDSWLPAASLLALMTNSLNLDWMLICRQEQRIWANKMIISSIANVVSTATLLALLKQPTAVLLGICITNIVGWFYLRRKGRTSSFTVVLPTYSEIRKSTQLTLSSVLVHSGYNTPLLVATAWVGGLTAGAFAGLYRVFSASTMLIPPFVEFSVSREISKIKIFKSIVYWKIYSRLLLFCAVLISPIMLTPAAYLHALFSKAIELTKFQIISSDFNLVKVAILLYCFEYCAQKTAYILDQRKILIMSSFFGLLGCIIFILLLLAWGQIITAHIWFYPLYCYQGIAAVLIITMLARKQLGIQQGDR